MTTDQILIGVGLILALAAGYPQDLLGPAFEPLVSLSVAVILYDAGLSLDMRKLKGHTRKVVIRLIVLGVLITWVLAASLAAPLLGMSRGAAVMLGIILVVCSASARTASSPPSLRPARRRRVLVTPSCPWGLRSRRSLRTPVLVACPGWSDHDLSCTPGQPA